MTYFKFQFQLSIFNEITDDRCGTKSGRGEKSYCSKLTFSTNKLQKMEGESIKRHTKQLQCGGLAWILTRIITFVRPLGI